MELSEDKVKKLCEAILHGIKNKPYNWDVGIDNAKPYASNVNFDVYISFSASIAIKKFMVNGTNIVGGNFPRNRKVSCQGIGRSCQ